MTSSTFKPRVYVKKGCPFDLSDSDRLIAHFAQAHEIDGKGPLT